MRNLIMNISDIVEKINLKIFEEKDNEKTMFIFEINDTRDGTLSILRMEEKVAALIFEGLNNIFIETDDVESSEEEDSLNILKQIFETIRKQDEQHFGKNKYEE